MVDMAHLDGSVTLRDVRMSREAARCAEETSADPAADVVAIRVEIARHGKAAACANLLAFCLDGAADEDYEQGWREYVEAIMVAATDVLGAAYADGYADGLAWDLDGYETLAEVEGASGWDTATISAMGPRHCRETWGIDVDADDELWDAACEAYNRGAHAGATAPQSRRSGLSPRSESGHGYR